MVKDERLRSAAGFNLTSNFTTNVTIPFVDTRVNVGIFSAIIGSVFLFGLLRALMFFKVTVDASQHLHNQGLNCGLKGFTAFNEHRPCADSCGVKGCLVVFGFVAVVLSLSGLAAVVSLAQSLGIRG